MIANPALTTTLTTETNATGFAVTAATPSGFRYSWTGSTGGTRIGFAWTVDAEIY